MDAALQKELFDLARTIIERLSSGPVVALVVILVFRKQLATVLKSVSEPLARVVESLLSRSFKLGFNTGWLKLEAEAAVTAQAGGQPAATGLDPRTEERLQAVRNINVPPIVVEQEGRIRTDLNNLHLGQQEQIDLLVKHLAVTQLWYRAENTYRTIFGSQIAILRSLNVSGISTKAQLLQFYDNAKAAFPQVYGNYSFDQYLNYLLSQGLIIADGPEQYRISPTAKEFLKWMTDAGLSDFKPF